MYIYSSTLHLPFELISGQTIQPAKQIILFLEVQSAENCFVTKETVHNETKKVTTVTDPMLNLTSFFIGSATHFPQNTDYCEFYNFLSNKSMVNKFYFNTYT